MSPNQRPQTGASWALSGWGAMRLSERLRQTGNRFRGPNSRGLRIDATDKNHVVCKTTADKHKWLCVKPSDYLRFTDEMRIHYQSPFMGAIPNLSFECVSDLVHEMLFCTLLLR